MNLLLFRSSQGALNSIIAFTHLTDDAVQLPNQNTILIARKIMHLSFDREAVRIFKHAGKTRKLLPNIQCSRLHYWTSARMR